MTDVFVMYKLIWILDLLILKEWEDKGCRPDRVAFWGVTLLYIELCLIFFSSFTFDEYSSLKNQSMLFFLNLFITLIDSIKSNNYYINLPCIICDNREEFFKRQVYILLFFIFFCKYKYNNV